GRRELLRSLVRLVHDRSSIDHVHDAKGGLSIRLAGLQGEVEDRDVQRRGLSAAGREVENGGPGAAAGDVSGQAFLPRKRLAAVYRREELGEISGIECRQAHASASGRKSPSPRYRPAPSKTGPRTGVSKTRRTCVRTRCVRPGWSGNEG